LKSTKSSITTKKSFVQFILFFSFIW
jgi:hypothetical protein